MSIQDEKNELHALLTTKEVADLWKVSTRHVQNMVKNGSISGVVWLGRSVRFRQREIRRILNGDSDDGLRNQAI
jgi:excisionase family DNA binding protein